LCLFLLVILLYDAKDLNELKKKQIDFFKSKLNNYDIGHVDISSFFKKPNWQQLFREELQKSDAVFILYDNMLGDHFDDKNEDIEYKYIGTELYLEYFHNEFKNFKYYTFLINNCTSLNYYWLENIHYKCADNPNKFDKKPSKYFIKENFISDFEEVDKFLREF
jgi:hypothetical protein